MTSTEEPNCPTDFTPSDLIERTSQLLDLVDHLMSGAIVGGDRFQALQQIKIAAAGLGLRPRTFHVHVPEARRG